MKPLGLSRRTLASAACGILWLLARPVWGQPVAAPQRIGVYDSRAVAVAYGGSAFKDQRLQALKAQHQQAQQAGDTAAMARLQAEGRAWQAQLHQQAFGTAPVDDILLHIAAELPAIQQAAGVTRLVSKWDRAELDKAAPAEQVDLTMALVDALHPTAKQRKYAQDIQAQPPQAGRGAKP
jgi:hypothetical protein